MTELDRYLDAATRQNTVRSYASALRHFEVEWQGHLPATPDSVARYLAAYAQTLATSTLRHRLAAIASWHRDHGFVDPTRSPLVRKVLKGIQTLHPGQVKQAAPLQIRRLVELDDWLAAAIAAAHARRSMNEGQEGVMSKQILVLPGDGIGPEIMAEAVKVLELANDRFQLGFELAEDVIGGAAIDQHGVPLADQTLQRARQADAVLLGAVGGPKWDRIERDIRPERGLLKIRSQLGLFANLRPAILYPQLAAASSLKPEVVAGLDILIVRELTGGIYFGQPREQRVLENGERQAYDTLPYSESEIRRIARVGFDMARVRNNRLCSVDKANVLDSSKLWRELVEEVAKDYPDVELSHMYVDNAAMQLVRAPKQFDVMVTDNMFGDILSDEASMLTGSIGMLPSASLDANNKGMYEPCHGSAPDIAGQGIANPLATILSVSMMLRYSFSQATAADAIEQAVSKVLDQGLRTGDIWSEGCRKVGTREMGDAVVAALKNL